MKNGIRVYTEATCGRCGEQVTRPGAEATMPPIGWSVANITKRLEGSGWANNEHTVSEMPLCPFCAELCARYLKEGTDIQCKN